MGAIDDTFGAWFIGMQVATVAFGFSILQTWIFFQRWDTEQHYLKLLVVAVFILGFALVFLTSHGLYHYLVSSVGNPAALMEIVWSFNAEPWVSEALVVVTHCFYTGRIFYLNRNYLLFVLLLVMTLGHCVLDLVAAGLELSLSGIAAGDLTKRLASAGLGMDLTIDVIVMFSMFHFFHHNRTGFKTTQSLMNRLAMYTFASGSLTVIANAVILAMFITKPQTQIYSGASFVLPHLYANSLLAVLNARESLRQKYTGDHSLLNTSLPSFRIAPPSPRFAARVPWTDESYSTFKETDWPSLPQSKGMDVRIPSPALHIAD